MKITYFGEQGSFSEMAARRRFKKAVFRAGKTAADCFEDLRRGRAEVIVVPIENASGGMIDPTVDEMNRFGAWHPGKHWVREELLMSIELLLLARGKRPLSQIKRVYSHRAPFDHCHSWLKQNLPKAQRVLCGSTPLAAAEAAQDSEGAAIASAEAAQLHGLEIINREVGRKAQNRTKFFAIGKGYPLRAKPGLATVFFELPDTVGALCDVLTVLKENRINLSRISSRPIYGRQDEYTFNAELELASKPAAMEKLMARLKPVTDVLTLVGHYPLVRI
ncbi:MAG: prephenate dehydratase domain-containing protein [Verrucomicrobiae bacterium]|nr:prephenate dehydratase domain-containing protein [Verrucomicrobiae bacterium]